MKRQKFELVPTLKAKEFTENAVICERGVIKSITNVVTKFDSKARDESSSVLSFVTETGEKKGIFLNTRSTNNLIDGYTEEDSLWIGKPVRVVVERDETFDSLMFVAYPVK